MSEHILVIDSYEGQGLLDLQALKENGVRHVMVRLGCYNTVGINGNRKDKLFDQQWAALKADPYFSVGVYLPYNPWKNWVYNLKWLLDNLPVDCRMVEWDVENSRTFMYSSKSYAADVDACVKNMPSTIRWVLYTAEWFLPSLSYWPKALYSWAQYPYALRPSDTVKWTWSKLRELLSKFTGPSNSFKCPGRIGLWQFTGDKVVLPGSLKGLDVYAWMGTEEELDALFDGEPEPTSDEPPSTTDLYPAIPGPIYLLSHKEAGEGWFWPDGKLDAYPAAIATRGGEGSVTLKYAWLKALRAIMTSAQWARTWVHDEGWHNTGDAPSDPKGAIVPTDTGAVKQVEFAHNVKWVTGTAPDGWYEYETYSLSDAPPNLLTSPDKYRQGVMTVDYKTGHEDTGGVVNSDLQLPYISVSRSTSEKLRLDPKYVRPLVWLPMRVLTKTPGSRLNVREGPSTSTAVLTTISDGTSITVFELRRVNRRIWGRITANGSIPGWVAMWLTDWTEPQ